MRVVTQEMLLRLAGVEVAVGEVAAATTRDANFFRDFWGVIDEEHSQAQLACDPSAEQPCSSSADDSDVELVHGFQRMSTVKRQSDFCQASTSSSSNQAD